MTAAGKLKNLLNLAESRCYPTHSRMLVIETLKVAADIAEDDDNPHRSVAMADAILAEAEALKGEKERG